MMFIARTLQRALAPRRRVACAASSTTSTRWYGKKANSSGSSGSSSGSSSASNSAKHGSGSVILSLRGVDKSFEDGELLFKDVQLGAFDGAKIGVVGVNGSGKSCLLKIIAGVDDEFFGERVVKPGIRIGYLSQEPQLDDDKTVEQNVLDGIADKLAVLAEHARALADPARAKDAAALKAQIDATQAWGLDKRIYRAMAALRCPPPDNAVTNLSGGEKRRVALCKLLVSQPDVLLLDEPTNHLDAASVAWLQRYLDAYRGTVIAITHDRYFLDGVAGWILEVDRGRMIPFQGNYSAWLVAKQRRLESEKRKDSVQQRMLERELAWINAPAKARQTKSRARIAAYEERLSESKRKPYESGTITIPPGRRLGGVVLRVDGLSKSHGDKKLFENLSFELKAGQVLGVVGPNGCGKTSLLRILTGEDEPDSGSVKIGETVDLGFVTQSRDSLDEDNSVYDEIAEGNHELDVGSERVNMRAFVAAFNFKGDAQQKSVGSLSGGERNRVHLAKMIKSAPNMLLLDEPTNDLDVEVLRNLESSLESFSGSAVIVSHDRFFIDRVCTHILLLGDNNSKPRMFEGTWAELEEQLAKERGKKVGADDDVDDDTVRKLKPSTLRSLGL
jgi:ATP-binding cassette ChvD family protein